MEPKPARTAGSATMQGRLWGMRSQDWSQIQEGTLLPLFEAVLDKTEMGPKTALLDIGCGAGLFCQLAAMRGTKVAGIDASPGMIQIAQRRTPQGDFRVGEMEELPYEEPLFDLVTGFNSFQYAFNPINALKEAARVARKGAQVVIAVWGREKDCEGAVYLGALNKLLPPSPPGTPGPFALSESGALEFLAAQASLEPGETADVDCPWVYPDEETALRGLLSAGPAVKAMMNSGENRVRETVLSALAPFRTENGGYSLRNKFHYLITRKAI